MRGQATILFEQWKRRDYDSLQREEAERAGRDATITLGQWKADSERNIRRDAVTRSQAVTVGKVSEHIAPYLPNFAYNPKDARFIGSPVDFVVFDGLNKDMVTQVVFVEVKSGSSTLTTRERSVRDAIKSRSVRWEDIRVPAAVPNS